LRLDRIRSIDQAARSNERSDHSEYPHQYENASLKLDSHALVFIIDVKIKLSFGIEQGKHGLHKPAMPDNING
jgi:hypothetical protein